MSGPRPGSIGAASVGASSLGACRDAPAAKRAPSVRSDERPIATQGDMLNSIKFQRRFRDTLNTDKVFNDKGRNPGVSNVYTSKVSVFMDKPNLRTNHRLESSKGNSVPWRPVSPPYKQGYNNTSLASYCWPRPPTYLPEVKNFSAPKETTTINSPNFSAPKEKSVNVSPKFYAPTRPTSPKGRSRTTSFF